MSEDVELDQAEPAPVAAKRGRKVQTPGAPQAEPAPVAANAGELPDRSQLGPRSSHLHLHSSQVDVTTLAHPVLCADGWLLPEPRKV